MGEHTCRDTSEGFPLKFLIFAVAATLLPATVQAQKAQFVSVLGSNALAVETFTLTPTRLQGELVPQMGGRITYDATMEKGRVRSLRLAVFRGTDKQAAESRELTFRGDTVPFLNLSFVFLELETVRMVASGVNTVTFPVQVIGGPVMTATLKRTGENAELSLGGVPLTLTLDAKGHILNGTVASQGLTFLRKTDGG